MTNALSLYEKVSDPIAAATELGKWFHQSGIMRLNSPGDGVVVAMTCLCEGLTPLEFARTYHIVEGKPSMQAHAMAAKFKQMGGSIKWHDLGDRSGTADATFAIDGEEIRSTFTMEDAKRAVGDKLTKAGSNWQRDPSAMLRARLISKVVRILKPEIVAGIYDPDELEHIAPESDQQRTPEQIAARKAELEQMAAVPQEPVIDVEPEPVAETKVKADPQPEPEPAAPVAESNGEYVTDDQLGKLAALGDKLGFSLEETKNGILEACDASELTKVPRDKAAKLIERFETMVKNAV